MSGKNLKIDGKVCPNVTVIKALDTDQNKLVEFVDTSDANATSSDIITGKTAYVDGKKVIGEATAGIDTSDATAIAADIRLGKTAYAKDAKLTGTIEDYAGSTPIQLTNQNGEKLNTKGKYCPEDITVVPQLQEKTVTPSETQQTATPDANYAGLSKVIIGAVQTKEVTVTPAKGQQVLEVTDNKYYKKVTVEAIPPDYVIPSGTIQITENGVVDVSGKANANVNVPTGVDTNDATAVSGDILQGKTAYAKGVKLTGSIGTYDGTFVSNAPSWKASVSNLGAENPTTVVFNTPADSVPKPWSEVEFNGDVFIKFPKMYRKIVTVTDNQITAFEIADKKLDNSYKLYPCFIDESGNELDYILVGKYMSKSSTTCNSVASGSVVSQTLSDGRTKAIARGTGYQLMDWRIHRLWQDLLICAKKTVNTNSGSGIATDALGLHWGVDAQWMDGFGHDGSSWVYSNSPSKYIDSPTAVSDGYAAISGYTAPISSGGREIKKLGYDSTQPFFNYPSEVIKNSSYNTYYCDDHYYSSGYSSVRVRVGDTRPYAGAFCCNGAYWSSTYGVRLCYRPISS